jgi:hypothetical protein
MTKHIDTGEYIQAQQERIDRLQAELQHYRTNLTNGYGGETTTDAEIAQAIIKAYPTRYGAIAAMLVSKLNQERTKGRKQHDLE